MDTGYWGCGLDWNTGCMWTGVSQGFRAVYKITITNIYVLHVQFCYTRINFILSDFLEPIPLEMTYARFCIWLTLNPSIKCAEDPNPSKDENSLSFARQIIQRLEGTYTDIIVFSETAKKKTVLLRHTFFPPSSLFFFCCQTPLVSTSPEDSTR